MKTMKRKAFVQALRVQNILKDKRGFGTVEVLLILVTICTIALLLKDNLPTAVSSFITAATTWLGTQATDVFGS